jgi:hypothetical protein
MHTYKICSILLFTKFNLYYHVYIYLFTLYILSCHKRNLILFIVALCLNIFEFHIRVILQESNFREYDGFVIVFQNLSQIICLFVHGLHYNILLYF